MHPDKIKELEHELAHEDEQVAQEKRERFRSWEQRTSDAIKHVRQLMKDNPEMSFNEAAKKVGLIKEI